MSKYITHINEIDLLKANAIQCAELIFNVNNIHPAIIRKVEHWQEQQRKNNTIYRCTQEDFQVK
jgi:hypothetical protein